MASFALFIFTIFLLPVARSAGPTKCFVCEQDGSHSCAGKEEECAEKSTCLTVSSNTRLSIGAPPTVSFQGPPDHPLIQGFSRTCTSNNLNGSFSLDFGNAYTLEFTSKICNEKEPQCTFEPLVPPIRIYENGKSCPKCFRTGGDYCDADGEVRCVGDMVNCIDMSGEITHTFSDLDMTTTLPFAGKGCASPSVCKLEGKSFRLGTFMFSFKDPKCSEASGALSSLRRLAFTLEKKDLGPQVAFLLPCILGTFAVKIFS